MKRNSWNKMFGIAIAVSMTVLTACGQSGSQSSGGSSTQTAAASKTETAAAAGTEGGSAEAGGPSGTINFYYWDTAQTEAMETVIKMFEEDHPDIDVVATSIPSGEYWTKLQTSLPAGTGPDVFWMNLTAPEYYNAGLLYDISGRIKEDNVDMSVFPDLLKELYSNGDAVYGIPKDYDGIALFYNKAVFDEMQVEYPKDGMSWEELRELAKKVTTDDHYGFIVQNAGNICYQDFIYSNGGRISGADNASCEINEPESVEALQYLHDLMYVDHVAPSYSELLEFSADDMFIAGQAAMLTGGSWKMTKYVEELGSDLGICTMPVAKIPAITVHGLGYCINAKSTNIDASWEFVKFCATKEAQEATVLAAIPAYEGCDQLWAESYSDYDAGKLLEGIHYEGSLGNPWWDVKYTDANTVLKEVMTTIWSEADVDMQAVLDKCKEDIEALTKP